MAAALSGPVHEIAQGLIDATDELRASVTQGTAKQVQSRALRDRAKGLVVEYFRAARPSLASVLGEAAVAALDDAMHDLLDLSQKNGLRSTYKRTLKALHDGLATAEKACITRTVEDTGTRFGVREQAIFETLQSIVPSAALSYRQGCNDLAEANRLSYRGSATELREALRETLDHLASDKDVMDQPGFKLEPDQKQPTMKQKVRFVLRSRGKTGMRSEAPEDAVKVVDESVGALARSVYTRSSISTHTATTLQEVKRVKDYVDVVLRELLELP